MFVQCERVLPEPGSARISQFILAVLYNCDHENSQFVVQKSELIKCKCTIYWTVIHNLLKSNIFVHQKHDTGLQDPQKHPLFYFKSEAESTKTHLNMIISLYTCTSTIQYLNTSMSTEQDVRIHTIQQVNNTSAKVLKCAIGEHFFNPEGHMT